MKRLFIYGLVLSFAVLGCKSSPRSEKEATVTKTENMGTPEKTVPQPIENSAQEAISKAVKAQVQSVTQTATDQIKNITTEGTTRVAGISGVKPSDNAKRFDVYSEKGATGNHFIPSGWMGDIGDLKFTDQETVNPASGATCIKITYSAKKANNQGWAGIYWQSAQNNWGAKDTGVDLTGFNKLVFKARGEKGGEVITIMKIGGITKASGGEAVAYPDSTSVETGPFKLTKDWQEFSINLVDKDLHYINGGLCIVFNADQASGEQNVYLDDIYYTIDSNLKKEEAKINLPFYVYADSSSLDNHFIPSGWMPATAAQDLKLDTKWKNTPFSGDTCIRVEYKNNSGTRWAGIYWQQPANNWGTVANAGFNLQGATKLSFWARGEKGGEVINEFKMGGMASGDHPDSDSSSIGPVQLTKDWKKYEIDLRGKDLSYVVGGFCWATNIDVNDPAGVVFYLDEIKYEKE